MAWIHAISSHGIDLNNPDYSAPEGFQHPGADSI